MITAAAIAGDLADRIHTTGFPLSWSEPSEIFFTRENPHSHSVPVIISTSVIVRDQITGLTFDNHLPWHSDYASVYNATSGQSVSINET
ncbi:MAG: hypothetical protein SFX74_06415, partial [Fimbriimonadaceae bacterium]|nr:hypothetical protein [Fimbriimonadaceae bacterium]